MTREEFKKTIKGKVIKEVILTNTNTNDDADNDYEIEGIEFSDGTSIFFTGSEEICIDAVWVYYNEVTR